MIFERIFHATNGLKQGLQDWFGLSAHAHTRLYTVEGEDILVADDASMASLMELRGSMKIVGETELERVADRLATVLQTPLTRPCHALQFTLHYDTDAADETVLREFGPIRRSAEGHGLDLDGVLADWAATLAGHCAEERIHVALWTRPSIMSQGELKRARKDALAEARPLVGAGCQGPGMTLPRMRTMHEAAVREVDGVFRELGYRCRVLEAHDALRAIRTAIAPGMTARDWRPCLPGDPLPLRCPEAGQRPEDLSNMFPPTLARQVWPCEATVLEGGYVRVDDRIHAPMVVILPPQIMTPFNALFQSLRLQIPYRCSILLTGDGMGGTALKYLASRILAFTSMGNKAYNQAYAQLNEAALSGECAVAFQMAFTTWVRADEDRCLQELARRAARLRTAVQSWGSCETTDIVGDPLLAFTATLPACTPASPAPKAIAPLSDAAGMLPLARVCSPWDGEIADIPFRTPDGRFMPVGLFHSCMASWNEIAFAGMGSGKSFLLNTINLFFVLRPGQARLPWLTIIDVGASCAGLIALLRAALPPERRHLAVFARLRNEREAAVNPFDTPLGCPRPLPAHMDFLVNLLSLLCTPHAETAPADGVADLLREAVDASYRRLAPEGEEPKRYDRHGDPDLGEWLDGIGRTPDADATWWEVADTCFDLGNVAMAVRAQRHAVPVLADVAANCNDPIVRGNFARIGTGRGDETVPDACVRHLTGAMETYPLLANPTRFDLGAAQIVGLDLQDAIPRGGPLATRQSAIMYMVARHVGAAHFFNTPRDLACIPERYRAYHEPRFQHLAFDPKRLCYDEFHRASCADPNNPLSRQIIADLATAARESRKQNLSIGLYSQRLEDFPKALVDLATSVYALGAGNHEEARGIAERFGLGEAAHGCLRRIARPTAAGANFIALYRTAHGESVLYLTNCVGPHAKWAFSTTAEDMRVRERLYEALGCRRALDVLARLHPEGTVKGELERRKGLGGRLQGETSEDAEERLVEELLAVA
ncbi:MAG: hypothetical protein LBR22_07110 [Desulfovibrio sp.]|jgi:intracellular multiplication protein IcmB|nr:hypothetical protein [Desulfovibrio sp.]